MSVASCSVRFPAEVLTAYWLGELDASRESALEEHLFACAECTERLHAIVRLGNGIRLVTRDGRIHTVLTAASLERLQQLGLRVREYRVRPGGSVMCTVTPDDDLVVGRLHAPLHDVRRLDVLLHDLPQDTRVRIEDVAFDRTVDEVVVLPNTAQLRQRSFATQHVKLLALENAGERVIGEYTFNHSPYTYSR
jgi:hypothetical protein